MARLIVFGEPGDPRKWIACANAISARIADGRYPAGEWLPPIAKISADLGIENHNSHFPVRRALKEIRAQKLISLAGHAGYYVGNTEPGHKPPADLRHQAVPRTRHAARAEPAAAPDPADSRLLTPGEVAAMFRVDSKTVTRWAKAGKLTSIRTLGGTRRYYASEAEQLLRDSKQERRPG